jgi:hypothetical protein
VIAFGKDIFLLADIHGSVGGGGGGVGNGVQGGWWEPPVPVNPPVVSRFWGG